MKASAFSTLFKRFYRTVKTAKTKNMYTGWWCESQRFRIGAYARIANIIARQTCRFACMSETFAVVFGAMPVWQTTKKCPAKLLKIATTQPLFRTISIHQKFPSELVWCFFWIFFYFSLDLNCSFYKESTN